MTVPDTFGAVGEDEGIDRYRWGVRDWGSGRTRLHWKPQEMFERRTQKAMDDPASQRSSLLARAWEIRLI